eukprot:CAMPEP_0179048470 /NCGR_PEP_ID=MMETSP0796-20121207/19725_1 /TAXON_ID=73915 /ORGANISM="Pyrodinium bahamense, Strain pbaha01" /LENGTH=187 /DNA_ID=CAMNT_0020744939 /DNA_START=153 /DNA_END=716 /DNA_ORIENTATION=+
MEQGLVLHRVSSVAEQRKAQIWWLRWGNWTCAAIGVLWHSGKTSATSSTPPGLSGRLPCQAQRPDSTECAASEHWECLKGLQAEHTSSNKRDEKRHDSEPVGVLALLGQGACEGYPLLAHQQVHALVRNLSMFGVEPQVVLVLHQPGSSSWHCLKAEWDPDAECHENENMERLNDAQGLVCQHGVAK